MPNRPWRDLTNPDFRGWRVVLVGGIMSALLSAFYVQGYGNFAVALRSDFGWSKTHLALGYSMGRAEGGLLGPVLGWALQKYGVRVVARVGVVLLSGGFIGFSRVQTVTQFFVAMAVMAAGGSMSGFVPVSTAVVHWFERRRSRALSLGALGFAAGGALGPVLVRSLESVGWRTTAAGCGVIYLVLGWPLVGRLGGKPSDIGQFVDGIDPVTIDHTKDAEGVSEVHFTAAEAIRTRAFWLISLGHGAALLIVGAVLAHLPLYLTEDRGMSFRSASYVVGILPLIQIVGMLAGGQLGDRVNKRYISAAAMVGHSVALLALVFAPLALGLAIFVPLHAVSWGIRGPLMQAMRADYFGSTSFGQILGISSMVVAVGMMTGPIVAGYLADRTGSYQSGFTILAIGVGFGTFTFLGATPPSLPSRT